MALRTFHPCAFGFQNQDVRVGDNTLSGGKSLSGYEDVIRTDGGGYWLADYTNSRFGGRTEERLNKTLAWRALNSGMLGGSVAINVDFCDRLHQPVGDLALVLHSDGTPFSDDSLYESSGAQCEVVAVVNGQAGGSRSTVMDIRLVSQRPLLAGERASYEGRNGWGYVSVRSSPPCRRGDAQATGAALWQTPVRHHGDANYRDGWA